MGVDAGVPGKTRLWRRGAARGFAMTAESRRPTIAARPALMRGAESTAWPFVREKDDADPVRTCRFPHA